MTHDLLFEIGVEELPPSYILPALEQLETQAREGLRGLRLELAEAGTYATPRRLTLIVRGLVDRQSDHLEEAMGPSVKVAYGPDGAPTRALLGFCQGRGVEPSAVRRVSTPKGEYVAVSVHHAGKPAAEVLPGLLASIAARLTFPKTMRWLPDNALKREHSTEVEATRFARPVRWLVALLDDVVLSLTVFGLKAGRTTRGHRFLSPEQIDLAHARDYRAALEQAFVLVDPDERAERIREQVGSLAAQHQGRVWEDEELEDLYEINNFLVEWPTAFAGTVDSKYTSRAALPVEVIVTALREHQKLFAVEDTSVPLDRWLSPVFVGVRNGDDRSIDIVCKGVHDVLTARLEDAMFYYQVDMKRPPASRIDELSSVVWMEGLGSLRDKAARLEALARWLAGRLAPGVAEGVGRAALLCKTDLLSEMIGSGKEYTSLEGIIGGYYAKHSGEPEIVYVAIGDHYRPRGPSDKLPRSEAGSILSIADKLDLVGGVFIAGKAPTGSQDPYGARRAANGVLRILVEGDWAWHLDLQEATVQCTAPFFHARPDLPQAEIMSNLKQFWKDRIWSWIGGGEDERGEAFLPDTVEAAMYAAPGGKAGWRDPLDCRVRTLVLNAFRGDPRFQPLVILFKRVANILAKATETIPSALDRARLTEPAERELAAALDLAREKTAPLWERRDYAGVLPVLLEMESSIHRFFDGVMVNAEDLPTRLNRLRLLAEVRELFVRGWDLSKVVIEGDKGGSPA